MKGTWTAGLVGEAQGKELQPLRGTLDFLLTRFAFSLGLCVCTGRGGERREKREERREKREERREERGERREKCGL